MSDKTELTFALTASHESTAQSAQQSILQHCADDIPSSGIEIVSYSALASPPEETHALLREAIRQAVLARETTQRTISIAVVEGVTTIPRQNRFTNRHERVRTEVSVAVCMSDKGFVMYGVRLPTEIDHLTDTLYNDCYEVLEGCVAKHGQDKRREIVALGKRILGSIGETENVLKEGEILLVH